jgi:negative regulator of genetic competence, sporulation and motility
VEYIKINDSKLKIILCREDLVAWDISAEELDYTNPTAKNVFEGLLLDAKDRFGFDTSGHRVLLQLFTSKDGGCELFVTRLEEVCSENKYTAEKEDRSEKTLAYSFEGLHDICAVCKRLADAGFSGDSSAYFSNDGRWFLSIRIKAESYQAAKHFDRFAFISEYGEREDPGSLSLYVCEYATPISQSNAVSLLSSL